MSKLYDHPEYYDVAFSWDVAAELDLYARLFAEHVPFPVKNILEPACGPGRMLRALAARGYDATGYDANPNAVAFARQRIAKAGLGDLARAVLGDMRTARFDTTFDAAINPITSIGYLLGDSDVLDHFAATGASLRTGGIYIVQLSFAWDGLPKDEADGWTTERDGVRIETKWFIDRQDYERKLSHQRCLMQIDDHGKKLTLEEEHTLRLWLFADWKDLIRRSGKFVLAAACTDKGRAIPLDQPITGETGNLFHVLKSV